MIIDTDKLVRSMSRSHSRDLDEASDEEKDGLRITHSNRLKKISDVNEFAYDYLIEESIWK